MAAPYQRRDSSGTAVPTTISGGISDTDLTFSITDATGWPSGGASGDFFTRIESEIVRCSSRTATTVTVADSGRGEDGTLAAAHSGGVAAEFVFTRTDLNEANYAVSQTVGKIAQPGDLLVGTGTNSLDRLARGSAGLPLISTLSTIGYSQLDADAYIDGSVTYAKLPDQATDTLLGRDTDDPGDVEVITLNETLEFTGGGSIQRAELTGDVSVPAGANDATIVNDAVTGGKIADLAVGTAKLTDNAVTTVKITDANVTLEKLAATVAEALVPVATIFQTAATAAPSGYLMCDGSVVSRTTYAALFAEVGTAWNTGGEAGTDFRLPDLRGRVGVGLDNMGGSDAGRLSDANTIGGNGGAQTHTLTQAELPNVNVGNEAAHIHGVATTVVQAGLGVIVHSDGGAGSTFTAAGTSHTHSLGGSGTAHNNMPPYVLLNHIIKT